MRKAIMPLLALALLLSGCRAPKQQPELTEATGAATEPETEAETEVPTEAPTLDFDERITALGELHETAVVLDEHGHLSGDAIAQYQASLQAAADSQEICAALVITDTLAGYTPERFASKYYAALFGEDAPGFLLLINNETGQDLYYYAGNVTVTDTDLRLARASRSLADGDFTAALDVLLPSAEDVLVLPPEEPEDPDEEQSEEQPEG